MKKMRTPALAAMTAGLILLVSALPASATSYSAWTSGSGTAWNYWQAQSGAVQHRHSLTVAEAQDTNTAVQVGIRAKYIVQGTIYTSPVRWGIVYAKTTHDKISQHQAASAL